MKIELYYFEACPSWKNALVNLRAALDEMGLEAGVEVVRVETEDAALAQRFTGSPSIRVDGQELFPAGHTNYALSCRLYATPEGMRGWPSTGMIRDALSAQSGQPPRAFGAVSASR